MVLIMYLNKYNDYLLSQIVLVCHCLDFLSLTCHPYHNAAYLSYLDEMVLDNCDEEVIVEWIILLYSRKSRKENPPPPAPMPE